MVADTDEGCGFPFMVVSRLVSVHFAEPLVALKHGALPNADRVDQLAIGPKNILDNFALALALGHLVEKAARAI